MAEISRFFADVGGDRLTTSAQFNRIIDQILQEQSGVIRGLGNALAVTNSGTLAVDIDTGSCIKSGRIYENTASVNKTLDAVTSGSKRYDRIVVRVDETARTMLITVIKGVESTNPSPPAIDGTADVLLAKILIDRSSGSYVYTLTDERVYCDGLVSKAIIAKLNAGTYSEDDIADGTSYKRVQAAKADALNSSTIVAGTIWSSGNDGNGGKAPQPKGVTGNFVGTPGTPITVSTLTAGGSNAASPPDIYLFSATSVSGGAYDRTVMGYIIVSYTWTAYISIRTAAAITVSMSGLNIMANCTTSDTYGWRLTRLY